jgi:SPP1 gp7 family putative phage head morphogenesis protein
VSPLEELIAQQRAALMRIERNGASAITATYKRVEERLAANLALLISDIEAARSAKIEVSPNWLVTQHRYQQLLSELQEETLAFIHRSISAVVDMQGTAVERAPGDAEDLVLKALGPAPESAVAQVQGKFKALPAKQLERLVGFAGDGKPLGELLAELGPESSKAAKDSLAYGVASGQSPRVIASDVATKTGIAKGRALTIARTEMLRPYREVTSERFRNSQMVETWTWLATLDENTCPACAAMNGTIHELSEGLHSHPNCFPAGTVVSGPAAVGATARHYEGEVVVLHFASGDELTVTPNHPILTARGWVAAGEIHEGCDVIRSHGKQGPVPSVNPDDDERPTLIEDVAKALRSAGQVSTTRMPTSPEDFHGDGMGGEVEVVRANGFLRDSLDSPISEPRPHQALPLGLVADTLLSRLRAAVQLIGGSLATSSGLMGGGGIAPILPGCPLGHHEAVGFGASAYDNSRSIETPADRGPRNAKGFRDGILALASLVAPDDVGLRERSSARSAALRGSDPLAFLGSSPQAPLAKNPAKSALSDAVPTSADLARLTGDVIADRVVDVFRRGWSGHVYNLETRDGWYVANSTIVHNCRCAQSPNTPSWESLGFVGIPDRRPPQLTPEQRFAALPEGQRLAILGRARLAAYEAGQITLAEMVRTTDSRRWGRGRRASTLTELGVGA